MSHAHDAAAHRAAVEAWFARARHLPDALLIAVEHVLVRLWLRSARALGDAPLRVLFHATTRRASARHPVLATVTADEHGPSLRALRAAPPGARADARALESLVTELLTVIGHLTAEVLTPALHEELASDDATAATAPEAAP